MEKTEQKSGRDPRLEKGCLVHAGVKAVSRRANVVPAEALCHTQEKQRCVTRRKNSAVSHAGKTALCHTQENARCVTRTKNRAVKRISHLYLD